MQPKCLWMSVSTGLLTFGQFGQQFVADSELRSLALFDPNLTLGIEPWVGRSDDKCFWGSCLSKFSYFFFGFFSFSFSSRSFILCGVGGDLGAGHLEGEQSGVRFGLEWPFWIASEAPLCWSFGGVCGGVTARPLPFSWLLGTGDCDWCRLWPPWLELTPLQDPKGSRKLGGGADCCWTSSEL